MPRPFKRGILGASTIILSKDIDKYTFMCGSNFYETDGSCMPKNGWSDPFSGGVQDQTNKLMKLGERT